MRRDVWLPPEVRTIVFARRETEALANDLANENKNTAKE